MESRKRYFKTTNSNLNREKKNQIYIKKFCKYVALYILVKIIINSEFNKSSNKLCCRKLTYIILSYINKVIIFNTTLFRNFFILLNLLKLLSKFIKEFLNIKIQFYILYLSIYTLLQMHHVTSNNVLVKYFSITFSSWCHWTHPFN